MEGSERKKIGKKASYVAIFGNIFLTIFNIAVGLLSGSTALVAEGFHTLSDVITSIITFVGFKIGMRPADEDHPYGHGKAEALVGLIIVVFLVVVAYEIISGVYTKIALGEVITPPDKIAAVMALIGIFINYTMTTYLIRTGNKINSPALIADGNHQKVDIFSGIAILIGVIGSQLGYPILDPLVGVVIALIIIYTAFHIGKDNVNIIMGKVSSSKVINDVKISALGLECVKGTHDIKINNMGPYVSVELHIELNKDLKLEKAHEIAHDVEQKIINDVTSVKMVNVHSCPTEVICKKDKI
ncbi:MAG: cation diffusion facilitator family transporter [Methanobacteriaceae archaeon]|nr:cation diffusion facilitator family transporter [Methanobacteriaceae archaeon]MDO9626500.1 cation diffusion facilitator family transporter [Methanobacteriaceae archaeon]